MTLISMFESFNPYMLRIDPNYQPPRPVPPAPSELTANPERETYQRTYSAPLANRVQFVSQGIKSTQTQFRLRDDYIGCNWAVPLLENFGNDCNLWVRTILRKDNSIDWVWQFQTYPRRINEGRHLGIFSGRPGTALTQFCPCISSDEFPTLHPGSMVNIIIEIMADPNEKHPSAYVEIPAVGPFDCWTQATRVGIRLEFLDDNG